MKISTRRHLRVICRVVEITILLLGLLCIFYTIGELKNIDMSNIIGSLLASMFSIIGSVVIIMIELKNNEMKEEEKLAPRLMVGHSPVFSIDKSKGISNQKEITIPIINCGMSQITSIKCNIEFSENLIHMLDFKDEGGFFLLKKIKEDKKIETFFNKSISLEPIALLSVGETKNIKLPSFHVQEYLNEIWSIQNRDKINELLDKSAIINLKISLIDYRQKKVNVSTELQYKLQLMKGGISEGYIAGDVIVDI